MRRRCADKPPGCAEYLGTALSEHPLSLSAHRLRIELSCILCCAVVDIYGGVRPLEAGILQTSPLHKNLNISMRRRCADKPGGYAESSGPALSAHPLGLSAHCLRIEL
jgi:hypothetical protein